MDSLNPDKVLEFMCYVHRLKHLPRRGWPQKGVADHEQISGHMYAMGMMTFILGDQSGLDRFKCLQLALVHDLAESIVGDITPQDGIPTEEKHRREDEAMQTITACLGSEIGQQLYQLYKEYEAKQTAEAKFVKDLDSFDLVFTATQYEKRDQSPGKLDQFFEKTEGTYNHPFMKRLVEALKKDRSNGAPTDTNSTE